MDSLFPTDAYTLTQIIWGLREVAVPRASLPDCLPLDPDDGGRVLSRLSAYDVLFGSHSTHLQAREFAAGWFVC